MQVNGNNYLNAKQVSQIRANLVGASMSSNPSIFQSVQHLDGNKNQTIDASEVSNNDIISLGKETLANIAKFFGISIENDTNSAANVTGQEVISGEAQDQIIENYAKPFTNMKSDEAVKLANNGKVVLSKAEMEHYYNAIIEDKAASGVDVVKMIEDNGQTTLEFSDGSFVQLIKEGADGFSNLYYQSSSDLGTKDGGNYFEMITNNDFIEVGSGSIAGGIDGNYDGNASDNLTDTMSLDVIKEIEFSSDNDSTFTQVHFEKSQVRTWGDATGGDNVTARIYSEDLSVVSEDMANKKRGIDA